MKTITRQELENRIATYETSVLIDVMLPESFARQHIPGAKNACVYEVDFLEQAARVASDKKAAVFVYGSSENNRASTDAAEKLIAAGYENVADFRGGLAEWFGHDLMQPPRSTVDNRPYKLDSSKSRLLWTGRSLTGAHYGTIKLLQGALLVTNGQPETASFTLDMNSIENSDISDGTMRSVLEKHLKSEDFFAVEKFPTASFDLAKVNPINPTATSAPNYEISGTLTMKNVAREVTFPALIAANEDGSISAEAHLNLDRTRWNVFYGSGRFYEHLGKHLVHDEISIQIILLFS